MSSIQRKPTKTTSQTKDETESKIHENPATEKKNSINEDNVNEIEIEKMSLNENKEESEGQEISEGNCSVSNSPKKAMEKFPNFCPSIQKVVKSKK